MPRQEREPQQKWLTCPHVHDDGEVCNFRWVPRVAKPVECPECRYRPGRLGKPWIVETVNNTQIERRSLVNWELTPDEIWALAPDRPSLNARDRLTFTTHEREAATAAARKALWWAANQFAIGPHTQQINEAMLIAAGIEAWEGADGN